MYKILSSCKTKSRSFNHRFYNFIVFHWTEVLRCMPHENLEWFDIFQILTKFNLTGVKFWNTYKLIITNFSYTKLNKILSFKNLENYTKLIKIKTIKHIAHFNTNLITQNCRKLMEKLR